MALQVIGSGFGRTGTMSTKIALGMLGFGPTHHMTEVFANPHQVPLWKAAINGEDIDWETVFQGYGSQVDWPGAMFWHETSIAFPQAKIVHTERPEADWWASFSKTIGKLGGVYQDMPLPPHISEMFSAAMRGFEKRYGSRLAEKDASIAAYRRNNQRVRELIPADRLLVFNVADGWDPLCAHLGVPVPAEPFPNTHPREEFWEELGGEPSDQLIG